VQRTIAIIGGSGVKSILKGNQKILGTPYGPTPSLTIGEVDSRPAVFLPRHGENHPSPPHKVNYRANIWGLKSLGVERIMATNAVGAIDQQLSPGEIVGMTVAPEAFLARELEMCYASISFVSNMAAGLQRTLSAREVEEKGHETSHVLNKILTAAIAKIPESRKDCPCGTALAHAQLRKEETQEIA